MGRGEEHKKLLIGLIVISSSLGLIILSCLCFCVYRSKQSPKTTKQSGKLFFNIILNQEHKIYICNKDSVLCVFLSVLIFKMVF